MELKLFGFIEEVLDELEDRRPMLEEISKEIEDFFEEILRGTEKGYLNINTRVKGSKSLKEKIIRNQYYQKYETKELLFQNVPDIIGVRIECRFSYKMKQTYINTLSVSLTKKVKQITNGILIVKGLISC